MQREWEGEKEVERGQIAYDKRGKTIREKIIPVGTKRKHMQGMISLNDWPMIIKCIYNSWGL